ncbi:MAG TPA: hypothetical protein VK200_00665 [Candidatus Limnocylindrales bacterium]|nr:hypothetical protein [Candidatus Limnocylindrales bacterium]
MQLSFRGEAEKSFLSYAAEKMKDLSLALEMTIWTIRALRDWPKMPERMNLGDWYDFK